MSQGDLDSFVDSFATRISSFNREGIAAAKALINQRSGEAPSGADLLESQATFRRIVALPESQARIAKLMKQGLQKRSDVELRLGYYLADLEISNATPRLSWLH